MLRRSLKLAISAAMLMVSLAASAATAAEAAAAIRSEIPISEHVSPNGMRRYSVPIQVGSTMIDAGLDTGSAGLRVLPETLQPADAKATSRHDSYSFGIGVKLDGVVESAQVAIGALSGNISLQAVSGIGCRSDRPDCPAAHIALANFRVMGNGEEDQGFKAILGTSLARADIDNPLPRLGAARWIVELPRPGETAGGRLILNPSDDEASGFAMLPVLGAAGRAGPGGHDSVHGCVASAAEKQKACGALIMDTGAQGIAVLNSDLHTPWADGSGAFLTFYDGDTLRAAEKITIGERAQASHLTLRQDPKFSAVIIRAGQTPYFAFSVLYESERERIGLKPRAPSPGAPQGLTGADLSPAD